MVAPKSGKASPGYQGKGAPAGTKHLTTNPGKAKPTRQLSGEDREYSGGKSVGAIANAKGGTMSHSRNNPNVLTGASRKG